LKLDRPARAVIRIVFAFPQRQIGSARGAAALFVGAMLNVYERVRRKGLAGNCRAESRQYAPSGTCFARFRVGGKLVWKSLKTATFSVAKQRLPDTQRDHRSKFESLTAFAEGKMTVGNAADVYLQKVRASISLKPRSKGYRELMIDFIRRSWPSLFETDVRKVSPRDCELWLSRYQQRYSPSVINNSIGTLRAIFDEAIGPARDSTIPPRD
jgi:hypothetical protein